MMTEQDLQVAEGALAKAHEILELRRAGLSRTAAARRVGLSGNAAWRVEYVLGLTNNSHDALTRQGARPWEVKWVPEGR